MKTKLLLLGLLLLITIGGAGCVTYGGYGGYYYSYDYCWPHYYHYPSYPCW